MVAAGTCSPKAQEGDSQERGARQLGSTAAVQRHRRADLEQTSTRFESASPSSSSEGSRPDASPKPKGAGSDACAAHPASQEPVPARAAPPSETATRDATELSLPLELTEEAAIGAGLSRLISWKMARVPSKETLTPFHCKEPPSVSLSDYLARICRFTRCSAGCLVAGLIYIDKLVRRRPVVVVSPLSCHRLVLISIVLAIKFHDDKFYTNAFYAKVGGVKLKEFNSMEAKFLRMVGWRLRIEPEEYQLYQRRLRDAQASSG